MGSQLTTLTSSDIQRFERDGYVVVRQAFSPADALAMGAEMVVGAGRHARHTS
jgi:hypothetical protein